MDPSNPHTSSLALEIKDEEANEPSDETSFFSDHTANGRLRASLSKEGSLVVKGSMIVDLEDAMNELPLPPPHKSTGARRSRGCCDRISVTNRMRLKKLYVFWTIKLSQLLCAIYIVIVTFSYAPVGLVDPMCGFIVDVASKENTANGVILVNGDYRPVVAKTPFEMWCLAVSRISAFSMYPVMIVVFFTKCKAWTNFFRKTPISMFMIEDQHELHIYAGKYIAFDVWVHTLFHLMRWSSQGNISLLWNHRCGLSGLIVVIATPLICFPMMYWKNSIPYEVRKGLHYLFYVFAVGMCFHVPVSGIPNGGFIAPVLGACICIYTLDALVVNLFMTEKIDTTIFQVLPSGVQMSMDVSESFHDRMNHSGFAYVCLPWVDKTQWHAFSLFENPKAANKREVFMLNTGDWTDAVHRALQRNTVRPVWVCGPFESPYNNAVAYDNQILVATGIGITPALSVIRAHKGTRRINLIWSLRDASMLEFFMEHLYLDHDGWNLIFYTGKQPLNPALEELNTNVRVIKGRPDLHNIIPNIIYGVESGNGLPETYIPSEVAKVKEILMERIEELDSIEDMTALEKLKDLTAWARNCGFLFTELLYDIDFDGPGNGNDDDGDDSGKESSHTADATTDTTAIHCLDDSCSSIEEEKPEEDRMLKKIRMMSRRFVSKRHRARGVQSKRLLSSAEPSARHRQMWSSARVASSDVSSSIPNRSSLAPVKDRMSSLLKSAFEPWKEHPAATEYVKYLDEDIVLSTWGMLYCGGNPHVKKSLKRISEEYHIALNAESFNW